MSRSKTKTEKITPESLATLINKRFGEGTMMRASDPSLRIKKIPTGILSIDWKLGGGLARGRHTEIFGSYAIGKTYTSLKLIATSQANKLTCAYVDVEGTFDPKFAKSIGIKTKKLAYHRQEHGNRVVDFIETLLRSRLYDVIVLDSIAALLPMSELESDMEAGTYGTAQAKLMSQALRKLTAANRDTALVYINQTRENVGTMFGKRTRTSGGMAMSFYAGTRLEMVKTENITRSGRVIDPSRGDEKTGNVVVGHRVLVRVEKEKTGSRPHDMTTFVFNYDLGGVDHIEDLLYVGRRLGLVHKSGDNWWVGGYEDDKQNGRPRFKRWLLKNTGISDELEEMIREHKETKEEEE